MEERRYYSNITSLVSMAHGSTHVPSRNSKIVESDLSKVRNNVSPGEHRFLLNFSLPWFFHHPWRTPWNGSWSWEVRSRKRRSPPLDSIENLLCRWARRTLRIYFSRMQGSLSRLKEMRVSRGCFENIYLKVEVLSSQTSFSPFVFSCLIYLRSKVSQINFKDFALVL